jgi:hypothetical protein
MAQTASTAASRNISVIHQILVISDIDMLEKSIYGHTELTIVATQPNETHIERISLNSKQCQIYCVSFNGSIETTNYEYCDPSLLRPCNQFRTNIGGLFKIEKPVNTVNAYSKHKYKTYALKYIYR